MVVIKHAVSFRSCFELLSTVQHKAIKETKLNIQIYLVIILVDGFSITAKGLPHNCSASVPVEIKQIVHHSPV
jgi:hypothetical protein